MGCYTNLPTNINGIPYLRTTNTTVGTTTVDLALGSYRRPLPPVGYFTVRISDAIPADTTTTPKNAHVYDSDGNEVLGR